MIEFTCNNCSAKLSAPESQAGQDTRCPRCKWQLFVPSTKAYALTDADEGSMPKPGEPGYDRALLDLPESSPDSDETAEARLPQALNLDLPGHSEIQKADKHTGERKHPWYIDIFLYPVNRAGLTSIASMILVFVLFWILAPFISLIPFGGLIALALALMYPAWYFAECVRDSAVGGTRAPPTFSSNAVRDMWDQMIILVLCYIVFLWPPLYYSLYLQRIDRIYWALVVFGSFFFPMGVLATVMFNSLQAFHPWLLIGSILSTFIQYCGLVLLMFAIFMAARTLRWTLSLVLFLSLALYVMLVYAHLIGRFYWRNEEKLNWEV